MFTCVHLTFTKALEDQERLRRELGKEFRNGLAELPHGENALSRAVYVIRISSRFLIAYEKRNSPVLYIGSGNCGQRLASHLKNWLSDVRGFGEDVGMEVRIACPRRRNRPDFFRYVEADMISRFAKMHGSIPFFNRRHESSRVGEMKYETEFSRNMSKAIGIGSGNRHLWALKPTKSNKAYATFIKGEHID